MARVSAHGSDDAAIAAFIRTRGVTRVAAGSGNLNHMTSRDWQKAQREPDGVNGETNRLIAQRVVRNVNGVDYVFNGIGERIA